MKNTVYRMMCVMSDGDRLQFNAWDPKAVKAVITEIEKPLFDFFEERLNVWLQPMKAGVGIQHCKADLTYAPENTALMYVWRCSKPVWQRWMDGASLVGFELWCTNSKDFEAIHRILYLHRPLMEAKGAKHEK